MLLSNVTGHDIWILDTAYDWIWMACKVEQLLSQMLEAADILLHLWMASLMCRDWVRAYSLCEREFSNFLFCFSLKTHDIEQEGLLLWHYQCYCCYLAGDFLWVYKNWERCIVVRHDRALIMCAARRAILHRSDCTWLSFHRKLVNHYISWSLPFGREISKIMTIIKITGL